MNSLAQIEITSRCNLKCKYCVHPTMLRPKLDMEEETYLLALKWAKLFVEKGTQKELNLAGIGESTLHPDFVRWAGLAREYVGDNCLIMFPSNGILFTDDMAKELSRYNIAVGISLHRPEKAGPAIEVARKYNMLYSIGTDFAYGANDWAGQVKWYVSSKPYLCPWIQNEWALAYSDGNVGTCCVDGDGSGIIGTLLDDLEKIQSKPYKLCQTCHQVLPKKYVKKWQPQYQEISVSLSPPENGLENVKALKKVLL